MIQVTNPFIPNPIYIGGYALGVDFNTIADTAVTIRLLSGATNYRLQALMVANASGDISAASVAAYSGAGATGTTIVTPVGTGVTTATANTAGSAGFYGPAIAAYLNFTSIFFRVTVVAGAARTANVYFQIQELPSV